MSYSFSESFLFLPVHVPVFYPCFAFVLLYLLRCRRVSSEHFKFDICAVMMLPRRTRGWCGDAVISRNYIPIWFCEYSAGVINNSKVLNGMFFGDFLRRFHTEKWWTTKISLSLEFVRTLWFDPLVEPLMDLCRTLRIGHYLILLNYSASKFL